MFRFSQVDPRWKNVRIDPNFATSTIGRIGCTAASFGMMIGVTPDEVVKRGHFVALPGSPAAVNWVWDQGARFPGVGHVHRAWNRDWGRIVHGVNSGEGVMIEIDYTFAGGWRHWILARSIQGAAVICTDPNTLPAREVTITQNQITGSAHYSLPSNKQKKPMSQFENEDKFNEWILKHGVARIQELLGLNKTDYGFDLIQIYGTVDRLREQLRKEGKNDTEVAARLDQYMRDNESLRNQVATLNKEIAKAAQAESAKSKEINMKSPVNGPVTTPEYYADHKEWALNQKEVAEKKLGGNLEKITGMDIDPSSTKKISHFLGLVVAKIVDRLTSSRLWSAVGGTALVAKYGDDTMISLVTISLLLGVYIISEIFIRYRKI